MTITLAYGKGLHSVYDATTTRVVEVSDVKGSLIDSSAKPVWAWAHFEDGFHESGLLQGAPGPELALGAQVGHPILNPHAPAKVTQLTEWFDLDGDGHSDARRVTDLDGSVMEKRW